MTLTFARAAAYIRPRAWLAYFAGACMWGIWLLSIALGGTRFEEHQFTAAPGGYDVQLRGRLAIGNGEWDAVQQVVSIDHLAFYAPAKMIREGRQAEIYDHGALAEYQASLFPPGIFTGKLEALRNPPFFALLHYPTASLSYGASCWIWTGIGFTCLVTGIQLLRPDKPWRVLCWALTFYPTFTVIGYGQTSLLSFAAFCGTYRLLEKNRPFAAGFVAGFLWFKPPLLLGLIVWWLLDVRRKWPALAGTTVAGALLLAITYPIVPTAWDQFFAHLMENIRFDSFQWWKSHNARAFWRLLLTTDSAPLPTILWVVSAIFGCVVFAKVWKAQRDNLPVVFGCSLLLMFWASPHTMVYEWVAAIIPAVLWWKHLPQHRDRLLTFIAVLWVAMFVSTDFGQIQELVLKNRWHWENPMILQVSVPIFGWVCWHLIRTFTRPDFVAADAKPSG